jgi:hypothetical protein
MNRVIFAAASAAALFVASAASAQVTTAETTITINADVEAKCGVSAQTSTINLNDLTDGQALVRTAVTQEIATALNAARIIPFCNGASNQVEIKRAVLARSGATGGGLLGDFAQYVRYNLDASIGGTLLDSTSTDGASAAGRFGGHNSASSAATHLSFAPAQTGGNAVAASGGSDVTAGVWSPRTDRRLAAGAYQGFVEVILTPGA